jgi:RNA polymerase sigma-70 factor (ECF subfamily)
MLPVSVQPDRTVGEESAVDAEEDAAPHTTAACQPNANQERLRAMFAQHFEFIWRSLRHLGLSQDLADDAAQQVFIIASRKLGSISHESERSFLFGSALRVASDIRRSAVHRREIPHADPAADLEGSIRPDEALEQRRARELLDTALHGMALELRSIFVLYEIEEMNVPEIAELLNLPVGTVSSRLRRARQTFKSRVEKLQRASSPRSKSAGLEGGGS